MTKQNLFILILTISFYLQTAAYAQEIDSTKSAPTIDRMRLPVLSSVNKKSTEYSLKDEVAKVLSKATRELRLYDIIVGIEIDSLSDNDYFDDANIINFKRVTWYSEAIVISTVDLSQQGVPPQQKKGYFPIEGTMQDLFKNNGGEKYLNNIRTELHLVAHIVDIKTQQVNAPFQIDVVQTGGSYHKSRANAMKQLKKKAITELKWFYWLAAETTLKQDGTRELPIGTEMGITKNMLFEIIEPDRILKNDNEKLVIPGGPVALATVVDTANEHSGLKILRQWRDDYAGCWAVEHPGRVHALQFIYVPPANDSYTSYGIQFNFSPLHTFDWGLGAQVIKVIDSFNDTDYGFGFSGFGLYRFMNLAKLDLGAKFGVDLDIPFRKDDADQNVSTALFSAHIGLVAEFLLSAKFDLVLMVGHRFGVKTDAWSYSEDEENYDAYWEDVAPGVDNSGFIISIATKILLK